MKQLKRKMYKIRIKLLYITNTIKCIFINKNKSVYIVSSKKYKNKIKEDLCLQKQFLRNNIYSKIVAWENNVTGDINLIRTVWGYHLSSDKFLRYVELHNTINSKDVIKNNIDKKRQYDLLKENKINTIDTEFITDISELKQIKKKYVIKPVVSASGNNTFIVEKKEDLEKCKELKNLIVQPYIEGIKDGEISVIVINKKIKYGIRRYPGIFTAGKQATYININSLPSKVLSIVRDVINIPEYQTTIIMRVDLVKDCNDYRVMEVELIDPELFIETIPDKDLRVEIYQNIVESVKKEM